jgi:superfamily II DNA helicase RecQ
MSDVHPPQAIIVAIDSTSWEVFQDFMRKLQANNRLARIIVDEAHLALEHESFRPVMGLLKWIGGLGVQIVLQTATLPPTQEQALLNIFGITMCHVSHTETPRPNISYNVVRAAGANLDTAVSEAYQKAIGYSETNRVLIFCRSKADARHTTQMLNIPHCDADMSQDEINALLGSFWNGSQRAISSTSILGVGLDIQHMTHVIHRDYPANVVSFVQEVGRLGHDEATEKAWSIVVLPALDTKSIQEDGFGALLIRISLNNSDHCHRLLIQMYLDGVAEPCTLMEGRVHMCDVCEAKSRTKPATFERLVFPSGLMEQGLGRKFFAKIKSQPLFIT